MPIPGAGSQSDPEEQTMSFRSVVGKTCAWCVVAATAVLSLLAVVWVVILASNQ